VYLEDMETTRDDQVTAECARDEQDRADRRLRAWARRQDTPMTVMQVNDGILVRDFPGLFS
jgi:hypothetical protein